MLPGSTLSPHDLSSSLSLLPSLSHSLSLWQLAVLDLLSPKQTAELMVLPLPHPQGKDEVINRVLDHLLESPVERNLPEVLYHVIVLSTQVKDFQDQN